MSVMKKGEKGFDRIEEIIRKLDQGTPETRLNMYEKMFKKKKIKFTGKTKKKKRENKIFYIWLVSRR
jgi:hypothetical protein